MTKSVVIAKLEDLVLFTILYEERTSVPLEVGGYLPVSFLRLSGMNISSRSATFDLITMKHFVLL